MSFSPVRLNHAVLFVSDVDRAVGFYTATFGMEVVTHDARMGAAFLRLRRSGNHHDLGLFGVGTNAPRPVHGAIGLYHLAWQVDTVDDLATARREVIANGAYTGESSHGATKSIYGADPDGNHFEIMWMLPRDQWGEYERSATVEPLDLAAEITRWSGVGTAAEALAAAATGGRGHGAQPGGPPPSTSTR